MDKYSTMTTDQLAAIDAIRNKGAFVEAFGKLGQRTVAQAERYARIREYNRIKGDAEIAAAHLRSGAWSRGLR